MPGVEIAQADKQFTPAVTVVTVGSAVSFPNRDTVRHHVYSFSPAKTFELKLYIGTPANPVVFDKPGIAVLGCNIHDTMAAWVVVVDTPHHGLTAASGRVRLADVPPGSLPAAQLAPGLPPARRRWTRHCRCRRRCARPAAAGVQGVRDAMNPAMLAARRHGCPRASWRCRWRCCCWCRRRASGHPRQHRARRAAADAGARSANACGSGCSTRSRAATLTQGATLLAADYGFRARRWPRATDTMRSALENHGARIGAAMPPARHRPACRPSAPGPTRRGRRRPLRALAQRARQRPAAGGWSASPYQFVMVPLKAPLRSAGW
jgi:hypothetical protein